MCIYKLNVKRDVHEQYPLKDRQPRQKIQTKKKLSEIKGKKTTPKTTEKKTTKSKKTTKRDSNRTFRKR